MKELEQVLVLFVAAVALAGAARRVGAPYPVFLAIGGALLALLPSGASFSLPPELALALFVAPVLLDAAYDTSVRDLKDSWRPVAGLVVGAVALTTAAVAIVTRYLMPEVAWAPAIVLGAVVAPPDAVAATAVLRQLRLPHRLLTILGGESLLNDATALLIYRVAVGAVAAGGFAAADVAPAFLLAVVGSVVAGPALGWMGLRLFNRIQHVPTAVILQFVTTFGVWIVAEYLGLSGVLTMVGYAMTVAQTSPAHTPARVRIPTYAVWETVVFALNILAFIFIGLQIRPILAALEPGERRHYFLVAAAIVATVIVVRILWQLAAGAWARMRRRLRRSPRQPLPAESTAAGSLLIGWSGMRGIVSLAAALALPSGFPQRDLIVLAAFSVVLATLVIQGLTLKPLLRLLRVDDDDPIGREVRSARRRALQAGLASLAGERSAAAATVREELAAHFARAGDGDQAVHAHHGEYHQRALRAARDELLGMRASNAIGDDAFHLVEEELDWLEMASGGAA
jgi:CPA1 family monovalent cation:H+ antiporter